MFTSKFFTPTVTRICRRNMGKLTFSKVFFFKGFKDFGYTPSTSFHFLTEELKLYHGTWFQTYLRTSLGQFEAL